MLNHTNYLKQKILNTLKYQRKSNLQSLIQILHNSLLELKQKKLALQVPNFLLKYLTSISNFKLQPPPINFPNPATSSTLFQIPLCIV